MFQLDARPTADQGITGLTLAGSQHSRRLMFSMAILSLPLIPEGQLSVSGDRMSTILVNRLEDLAYPVKVWLGKLTALDMTPLGWLGRKNQHKQDRTNLYKDE